MEKPRDLQSRGLRLTEEARRRSGAPAFGQNRRETYEAVGEASRILGYSGRRSVQVRALSVLIDSARHWRRLAHEPCAARRRNSEGAQRRPDIAARSL